MIRIFLMLCLVVVAQAVPCFAEDAAQQPAIPSQNPTAWQNIKDFEDTTMFAVAGPPTAEDAERAKADTQLYIDMVNNFDDLEDEDDDYLFVIEALFDPEDSSRPASLRMDDEDAEDNIDENPTPNLNSSIYIDAVRPTFFPGFQIKPRTLEPDKKENAEARSLFADLDKPKADDILKDDVKPIIPGEPPAQSDVPVLPGTTKDDAVDAAEKAGKINAPPKAAPKRTPSPDEETLGALKEAVKELGLEKKLNLGKGAGGHQALENNEEAPKTASTAPDVSQQKRTPLTAKQRANMKKKMRKAQQPRRHVKPVEAAPEAAPPPPKESGGLLDDLF